MHGSKFAVLAAALAAPITLHAASATLLGWNNLGMHCMDSDYSVFTILPPYNTIEAQLVVDGKLVTNGAGYTVTYQAVADASGSINTTAIGKGNFYNYTPFLYGAVAPDVGLLGWSMPGPANVPQTNVFETLNQPAAGIFTPVNWWRAEGIPISPYDDALRKNPYPMMRMIAWSGAQPIATNDVVLPVSDEMDCRACHASGTQSAAQPSAGWVWDGLPERDYRLNILRLHDERQFAQHPSAYAGALATNNYNPAGLYRRVTAEGKPVLCALCHASEALGTSGYPGVPPLTASVHSFHAHVLDPVLKTTLDSAATRGACYRCHPGSATRCLRGSMGSAIAADGSMEMQCQSCHGNMSTVGTPFPTRIGWFMEPNCQGCHTGTAMNNNGQIRYTSVFTDTNGTVRVPVDQTFATTPNTPPTPFNLSLYRFSVGHGGLQCSACHGSTHAEFPSSHANDNVRNQRLQGHAGVMIECTACHATMPVTVNGGPHGMHPISQAWVDNHHDLIAGNSAQCRTCHGADYRGTVLSRAQAARAWSAFGGTINFKRGDTIGCYTCHLGPSEGDANPAARPVVANVSTNTVSERPVAFSLPVTGAGAAPRIISQPVNGSVGLDATTHIATYFPAAGFVGTDQFTFAAYDGAKNSILATGTVSAAQGPFSISAAAQVPPEYPAAWPVPFGVEATVSNQAAPVSFQWDFGDGSAPGTEPHAAHTYAAPGQYHWSVISTASTAATTNKGTIAIGAPVQLGVVYDGSMATFSWPKTIADTLLESSDALRPDAQWQWVTNTPLIQEGQLKLSLPATGSRFFRVRSAW